MFKLFTDMKNKLVPQDKQPSYRQYNHNQLKIIAMRTRMIFEQLHKKQSIKISQADSQFKKVQSSQSPIQQQYQLLQDIGRKVIEVETIKLLIQILRKIESYAPQIISTNGDISLLKLEVNWFQCILWYRKCKKLSTIQQFNTFCYNFFKGVDVTTQLNLKCQLFKVYQGLQYLDQEIVVPLDYVVEKVTPFVSFMIGQEELDEMKKINIQEIKKKQEEERKKNMVEEEVLVNPFHLIGKNVNPINTVPPITQPNNNYPIVNPQFQHPINPLPFNQNQNQFQPQPQPQPHQNIGPYPINPNGYLPIQPYPIPYEKPKSVDDQFAIDRFSKSYKIDPENTNQMGRAVPPLPKKQKNFKSQNLKLIDWQSMYQKEQQNPYINSSKAGLISPQYSISENIYDEKSLPYPPSGVINARDSINPQKENFYFDTLEKYNSEPVKFDENSFIKNIQNEFFAKKNQQNKIQSIESVAQNQQWNRNINSPHRPSTEFNEDDLLSELQRSNQSIKKESTSSQPKNTFGKLFGMKFKKNSNETDQNNQKQTTQGDISIVQPTPKQASSKPTDSIFDILSDSNPKESNTKPLNSQDLQNFLSSFEDKNKNKSKILKDKKSQQRYSQIFKQVQQGINQLDINNNGIQQQNQKEEHLDEDIHNLIESHKKQISRHSSRNSSNEYIQVDQRDNTNIQAITEEQKLEGKDDYRRFNQSGMRENSNQRFKQSTLRYSEDMPQYLRSNQAEQSQMQHQQFISNNQIQKQLQQGSAYIYSGLGKDLIDSLNVIKRHFGEESLVSASNSQESINLPTENTKKSQKKPYMVSIYAREQFMNSLNSKRKSDRQ